MSKLKNKNPFRSIKKRRVVGLLITRGEPIELTYFTNTKEQVERYAVKRIS